MSILRTATAALVRSPGQGARLPRTAALGAGRGGQPRVLIDSPAARAEVYLHGAHVTSWVPAGGKEVIFTSREAAFDGETAIRGGVPLCLPWFAAGPDGNQRPAHGWGRISPWSLRSAQAERDGAVSLLLGAEQDGVAALYEVRAGRTLELTVSLRNTGTGSRRVEAALHTYLAVGDVTAVSVTGLEGAEYVDKTRDGERATQEGPLSVRGPVDRIYEARGPVAVSDPAGGRRIVVTGVDAPDVVVWNPWREGAHAFRDMADDEFASMLCVESAVVGEHAVVLEPGRTLSVGCSIAVESL